METVTLGIFRQDEQQNAYYLPVTRLLGEREKGKKNQT